MRALLPIAAIALGATAAVAATRDWTSVAAPAPQGSYVVGNPKARVKLVEYVSYVCPHCRHFTEEAAATLRGRMIRDGSVSLEVRTLVANRLDLAAAMLARCSGAAVFPKLHEALFAGQETWLTRGIDFDRANAANIRLYPQAAQLRALADGAGLTQIARDAGMEAGAIDRCFADSATLERTLRVSAAASERITGTPAFEINGRLVQGVGWSKLEPMLRAAGAR